MEDLFDEIAKCRTHIEAALKYSQGTHNFADIASGILSGRFQLWPNRQSAIVTEIIVYPRLKDLHFFLAGGDLDELKQMTPFIEEWGKSQGCSRVSLAGRPGWAKTFLKDMGYTPTWYVLKKDL